MRCNLKNFKQVKLTILHVCFIGYFLASNICFAEELAKGMNSSFFTAIESLSVDESNNDIVSSLLEQDGKQQLTKLPEAGLYIFVSHSMPKALLKSYLKEATKYKGVLVFKGLPNGSFKELFQLVKELTEDDVAYNDVSHNNEVFGVDQAGVQIDDEAFESFGVTVVPTIVLSRSKSTIEELSPKEGDPSRKASYDSIVGNVGIKYALEQFSSSGDLSKEALERLHEKP